MGSAFSQLSRQRGLRWFELFQRPDAAVTAMDMRSLNSLVTDSAAASTSWGSGSRVVNGALNVLPDGRELRPLAPLFKEAGWKRGLVTTTEITHATPAGFAANVSSRGDAEDIARQYLDLGIEVLLGGGRKFFEAARREDKVDLHGAFRERGYAVCQAATELADAPTDRPWLGTFASSHLPFSLDRDHDEKLRRTVPSLEQMTRRALEKLGRESRFLLQVEGGRVDHACHACDIAAAVREMVAFDEAIEVCLEFQQRFLDTLLVITTDHGTGGPALNGLGTAYGSSSPLFANLLRAQRSFEAFGGEIPKEPAATAVRQLLAEATGYDVPEAELQRFLEFLGGGWKPLFSGMNGKAMQLGQLLANYYGVSWTSGAHTIDYAPLLALGPGSSLFRGFQKNTDVFRHYTTLAGIDYRNPEVPLLAECAPAAAEVEPPCLPV